MVQDQFLRFIDRMPTSTESATWTDSLGTATNENGFIAFLAASTAYYDRT